MTDLDILKDARNLVKRVAQQYVIGLTDQANAMEMLPALDEAIARLKAQQAREGWQPIETAPKDETPVLTFRQAGLIAVAVWLPEIERWCVTDGCDIVNVTHWQSLPSPPPPAKGEGDG